MVTQISDWNDLDDVRNNLSTDFELVNDLDKNTAGYDSLASKNANSGSGWDPIGDSNNKFTGTFDGQNYTISDIYIDRPNEDYIGIFGFLNGSISNLVIDNIEIAGSGKYTGSLAGRMDTSISKVVVKSGSISSSNKYTAGLVSWCDGTIDRCLSTVKIEDSDGVTGGLVGRIANNGSVTNSYVLSDKVYTRDIQSPKRAGGFCGFISDGDINNSYSVVKDLKNINPKEQDDDIFYFVGELFTDGSVSDVYADTEIETTANLKDATGLTTEEMTGDSAETNMNFDFTNIWETSDGNYPILRDLNTSIQIRIQRGTETVDIVSYTGFDSIAYIHNTDDYSLNQTLDEGTVNHNVVEFSDEYIAYGGLDDKLYIQDKETYELVTTLTEASERINDAVIDDSAGIVAYCSNDNNLYVHNLSDFSLDTTISSPNSQKFLAVDTNTNYIAVLEKGTYNVRIYNLSDYSLEKNLSDTTTLGNDIAFDPSDTYLAQGLSTQTNIYNTSDWSLNTSLTDQGSSTQSIDWSSSKVCIGSDDVYAYETTNFTLEETLTTGSGNGVSINDNILIYGGNDNNAYVHKVSDYSLVATLEESTDTISSVDISQVERLKCDLTGSGTDSNPYLIQIPLDLNCLAEDIKATYKITNSLDCSDINWSKINFEGELRGDSNSIVALNDTLFKKLKGTAKNFGISAMTVENAAVAKINQGTIQNVGVRNVDISGTDNLGGLVGTNESDVEECFVIESTIDGNDNIGGLIGNNKSKIINNYVDDTTITANQDAGGVAGLASGTVENIYSGDITISGGEVGDLVGRFDSLTTINSYFDVNTGSGQNSNTGTGLTTSEMQGTSAEDNMFGFDFDNVWNVVTNPSDDYPVLTNTVLPPSNTTGITDTNNKINDITIDIKLDTTSTSRSQFVDNFTDLILNNLNNSTAGNLKEGAVGNDDTATTDGQDSLNGTLVTNNLLGKTDENVIRYTLQISESETTTSDDILEFGLIDSNNNLLFRYVFGNSVEGGQDIRFSSDIISL